MTMAKVSAGQRYKSMEIVTVLHLYFSDFKACRKTMHSFLQMIGNRESTLPFSPSAVLTSEMYKRVAINLEFGWTVLFKVMPFNCSASSGSRLEFTEHTKSQEKLKLACHLEWEAKHIPSLPSRSSFVPLHTPYGF